MEGYKERLEELKGKTRDLILKSPEIARFAQYVSLAEEKKFLDAKTKELISLGIAVAIRCEDCILWHMEAAIKAGANKDEIMDALKVAIAMAGSPALVYAIKALEIMEKLL
ncbi:MAG: carboxymuconolactone decarboxylase family protein [Candidatus Bathyarchaeia archaeon]